jgi:hypothetical protein
MYHIQSVGPLVDRTSKNNGVKSLVASPCLGEIPSATGHLTSSLESTNAFSSVIKQTNTTRYTGLLGLVTTRQKSRHTKALTASAIDEAFIVQETIWTARPSFMSYVVEMRLMQSFGQV